MKWMILIATIGRRRDKLAKLLDHLTPQTEPYRGDVEVRAYWNNGERPLAEVRQALVEFAADDGAEYISFIDDDDTPSEVYVDMVMRALEHSPDYVGWRMQHYADGRPSKPTYHSLAYGRWYDDDEGYYRDISHLNPIRTELAMKADFRHTSPPEDVAWCDQLRGKLLSEVVIAPTVVMYHYYSTGDSTWMPGRVKHEGHERLDYRHPYFDYIDTWAATWPRS